MASKSGTLSKEITISKKGKLPVKKTINLAAAKKSSIKLGIAIPAIIVILALAFLIGKFAIVDRYAELSKLQSHNNEVRNNIDGIYAQIKGFEGVEEEYAHYTYSDFSEKEINQADRDDVITMISKHVKNENTIDNFVLNDNTLVLTLTGMTLDQANKIAQDMETEDIVSYCSVQTASTKNEAQANVTVKITIYLNGPTDLEKAEEGGAA